MLLQVNITVQYVKITLRKLFFQDARTA